jgi:hypothetical protein
MPEPPTNRKEELLDEMIEAGKMLHAKTAREAAEIAMGRELADAEWTEFGPAWEARWYE